MQWQTVFTHPDVVWHTGQPAFDHFVLEEDPRIEWHATEPNTFASWSLGTSDTIIESPCFYANKLKWICQMRFLHQHCTIVEKRKSLKNKGNFSLTFRCDIVIITT